MELEIHVKEFNQEYKLAMNYFDNLRKVIEILKKASNLEIKEEKREKKDFNALIKKNNEIISQLIELKKELLKHKNELGNVSNAIVNINQLIHDLKFFNNAYVHYEKSEKDFDEFIKREIKSEANIETILKENQNIKANFMSLIYNPIISFLNSKNT